jgi:prepilin-type N-terminal cleavage/methylation domain-containing protein
MRFPAKAEKLMHRRGCDVCICRIGRAIFLRAEDLGSPCDSILVNRDLLCDDVNARVTNAMDFHPPHNSIAAAPGVEMPAAWRRQRGSRYRGVNLIELILTLSIISLLLSLLVPTIMRARAVSDGVNCLSNLRQIGFAFSLYTLDNGSKLPAPGDNGTPWEYSLHRYLPQPRIFECPADTEIGPVVGSSYDWRDTGDPVTTLAGKPLLAAHRGHLVLAFEALPGWHMPKRVNAAWTDGSVHTMDDDEFFSDLDEPVDQP